MQRPVDNAPLTAKLFSAELLIWMVGVVFALGVGYAALANGTESNAKSIREIKSGQKEVVRDMSYIKTSISRIDATQTALSARIQSQQRTMDRRMLRQESDIKDILNILRKEHNGGSH